MIEGVCEGCGKQIIKTSKQQRFCPDCKKARDKASVQKYYKEHAEEILYSKHRRREKGIKIYKLPPARAARQASTEIWCRDYAEKQKAKTLAMIGSVLDGGYRDDKL